MTRRVSRAVASPDCGFLRALSQLISGAALEGLDRLREERRGRKPTLPLAQLLQCLLFHFLFAAGTLAEHLRQLTGRRMAESTLADRRSVLDWSVFVELLHRALRPLARLPVHPEAFWHGLRLIAWDGSQFSLTNTPQNLKKLPKAASRRNQAAWLSAGKSTATFSSGPGATCSSRSAAVSGTAAP